MFAILAQAASQSVQPSQPDQATAMVVPRIFERLDTLAHPDKLVTILEQTGWVVACIFIAVGVLCLLQGYKLYKGVVLLLALIVGMVLGYKLGQTIQAEVIVAGCVGVLMAVVAWPFMKYAVAICGGLAGAFLGANCWTALATQAGNTSSLNLDPHAYWAGALIGLIFFGLLSFILFEVSIVLFTSVSGSVLAVLGVIALLLQVPGWRDAIAGTVQANPLVLPMLVAVPAVIGLVLQHHLGGMKKGDAKPKAAPAKA
ncbi:MAG: hypothetical protein WC058_00720 [Phycisphaeraceae bacterium]